MIGFMSCHSFCDETEITTTLFANVRDSTQHVQISTLKTLIFSSRLLSSWSRMTKFMSWTRTCWDIRTPACRYARTVSLRCLDCRGSPSLLSYSVLVNEVEFMITHADTYGRRWRESDEGVRREIVADRSEDTTRKTSPDIVSELRLTRWGTTRWLCLQSSARMCLDELWMGQGSAEDDNSLSKDKLRSVPSPNHDCSDRPLRCLQEHATTRPNHPLRYLRLIHVHGSTTLLAELEMWAAQGGARTTQISSASGKRRSLTIKRRSTASRHRCWTRENKTDISASSCVPDSSWRMSWKLSSSSWDVPWSTSPMCVEGPQWHEEKRKHRFIIFVFALSYW